MFINKVVQSLETQGLRYALVGGYAVAMHGAIRATLNLDFVIGLERSQFLKFEEAMEIINLVPRQPVKASEVFELREEYIQNRDILTWSFYNPANPREVVGVVLTQDLNTIDTAVKEVGDQKIVIAAIEDLITMKQIAGRPKDLEDIRALERLQ